MADRLAQWLVRHHPGWWRRRYEAEMLALLESDGPGAPAVADLARSCLRTWFECQLPSSQWGAGPWWQVALRLSVQLPLASITVFVTAVVAVILLMWALTLVLTDVNQLRPADFVLVVLAIAGPVAASGCLAIGAGLTRLAGRYPFRVTASCLAVAMVTMAGVLAIAWWSDPNPGGSLRLQRTTSVWLEALRNGSQMAFAYAAAVGLTVRLAFWGLPLSRCVVNCTHHLGDGRDATPAMQQTGTLGGDDRAC